MTPPGRVPKTFKLTAEELDAVEASRDPKATLEQLVIAKDIPVVMRSIQVPILRPVVPTCIVNTKVRVFSKKVFVNKFGQKIKKIYRHF
jgi:hypothetical protein